MPVCVGGGGMLDAREPSTHAARQRCPALLNLACTRKPRSSPPQHQAQGVPQHPPTHPHPGCGQDAPDVQSLNPEPCTPKPQTLAPTGWLQDQAQGVPEHQEPGRGHHGLHRARVLHEHGQPGPGGPAAISHGPDGEPVAAGRGFCSPYIWAAPGHGQDPGGSWAVGCSEAAPAWARIGHGPRTGPPGGWVVGRGFSSRWGKPNKPPRAGPGGPALLGHGPDGEPCAPQWLRRR